MSSNEDQSYRATVESRAIEIMMLINEWEYNDAMILQIVMHLFGNVFLKLYSAAPELTKRELVKLLAILIKYLTKHMSDIDGEENAKNG